MRIFNISRNQVLNSIEIFLTKSEAEELVSRVSGVKTIPTHTIYFLIQTKKMVNMKENS